MGEKIITLFCIVGKDGTVYETKHGDAEMEEAKSIWCKSDAFLLLPNRGVARRSAVGFIFRRFMVGCSGKKERGR